MQMDVKVRLNHYVSWPFFCLQEINSEQVCEWTIIMLKRYKECQMWFLKFTYVDLIVMQRSCSSFRVSVNLVSPAFAPAMIPALLTRESVKVDLPWSTWAITDILRIFRFLSIMPRISSTVKFTYKTAHYVCIKVKLQLKSSLSEKLELLSIAT